VSEDRTNDDLARREKGPGDGGAGSGDLHRSDPRNVDRNGSDPGNGDGNGDVDRKRGDLDRFSTGLNLPRLSIRRPVATIMAVLVVLLLGAYALRGITLDLLPDFTYPVAIVSTRYSGAGPKEVEKLVTRPVEEAVGTVNNVKTVSSESSEGLSIVVAEFNWGTDMDFATLEMREKVDRVRRFLPDDAEEPSILKIDPSMMPAIALTVSGGRSLADLKDTAEDVIKGRLERIEGVASVSVEGGREREIQVVVDPARLQLYGLAMQQVVQALRTENVALPGGNVEEGGKRLVVRTVGEFEDLDDVRDVPISCPGGGVVKLRDVAAVVDGFADSERRARLNLEPSIGLTVYKQSSANTVRVATAVLREMERLRSEIPQGIEFEVAMNQAEFITQALNAMAQNATVGALLAVAILFLFLGSARSTLVAGLAIPLSVVATFALIRFGDLTLNLMSLGGLALGVGMLVDNTIVVLENIFRHRQEGEEPLLASERGANEVANAITASTLTTLGVFLPVVFIKGLASELFTELALTVSFALFASLAISLTFTPMLSARLLVRGAAPTMKGAAARATARVARFVERVTDRYGRFLAWSLDHRAIVVGATAVAFAASLALLPLVGVEFMPGMDTGSFMVDVKLPAGTVLDKTDAIVQRMEQTIIDLPEVRSVYSSVGNAGMYFGGSEGPEVATVNGRLVPRSERDRSTEEIVEALRREFEMIPGAEVEVTVFRGMMGGLSGPPVSVDISGDDLEVLEGLAEEVAERVEKVPGVREVDSGVGEGQPEVSIRVNRSRAAHYGVGAAQIASTVNAAIEREVATRYRVDGEEIDVRVIAPEGSRQNLQDLRSLLVMTPLGVEVPVGDLAEIELAQGPTSIVREAQARQVSVTGELYGRPLEAVIGDIQDRLEGLRLPPGYEIEYGGEAEMMTEAFGSLTTALLIALVLVYAILATLYESFVHPLTIMVTVPLAFTGAAASLALTGRTLNVGSLVGVIMLAGIVVNNAIVLVDYLNQLRGRGLDRRDAIIRAGSVRLRPIVMTALTTVLGLFPLALGIGEGSEITAPLATVVMGGLLASTVLTLVVLPVMYSLIEDAIGFIFKRRVGTVPALDARADGGNER